MRDILDFVEKNILGKDTACGRSTSYASKDLCKYFLSRKRLSDRLFYRVDILITSTFLKIKNFLLSPCCAFH